MLRRTLLKGVAATAAAGLGAGRLAAQEVLKMGVSIPMTGAGFNAVGRQLASAIKLYVQRHGDAVAGRKLEIIVRDDGGVAQSCCSTLIQLGSPQILTNSGPAANVVGAFV